VVVPVFQVPTKPAPVLVPSADRGRSVFHHRPLSRLWMATDENKRKKKKKKKKKKIITVL